MRYVGFMIAVCSLAACGNLLGDEASGDDDEPGTTPSADAGGSGSSSGSSVSGGSSASSSGSHTSSSSSSSSSSGATSSSSGSSSGSSSSSGGVDAGLQRFTQVAAGTQATCGLLEDGTVKCTGQPPGWSQPSKLMGTVRTSDNGPALAQIIAIGAGNSYACALSNAPNRLFCWGSNGNGNIGDGTTGTANFPSAVVSDASTRVAISDWDTGGISQLAVGESHACARRGGGKVMCWGRNSYGQLGIPRVAGVGSVNYAVPVGGLAGAGTLDNVTQVAVGKEFSCALRNDKRVYCWGSKFSGSLGDGATSGDSDIPAPVLTAANTPLENVTYVSAGGGHACAVTSASHLYCWGTNSDKELGVFVSGASPSKSVYAARVMSGPAGSALANILRVSAGARHTCAIDADDALWCWGANSTAQLGNGSAVADDFPNPGRVQVSTSPPASLGNIGSVSGGYYHSIALDRSGTLFTWGDRGLGRDQSSTAVALPVVEFRP